mgnify:CR=1 FL=1
MNIMGRKVLSLMICGLLLSSTVSSADITSNEVTTTDMARILMEAGENPVMPLMAVEDDSSANTTLLKSNSTTENRESTEKLLEAAIKAVKAKIQIPKDYSEFDYYYYGTSAYSNNYWSLNWRNPENYSYIEVNLDKDNNFTYYSHYARTEMGRNIPSYLKKELKDDAEAFIKKIAPDVYKKLEYVDSSYNGIYSNTYTYNFQRIENGIIFPDNNVSVRLNASTGKVTSANIEWLYDVKIPSADIKLTKDQASNIIGDNLNMKLAYKTNYYRIFDNGENEVVKKAFLVYEPDKEYISVNANTGEVYLSRSEWVERSADDMDNKESVKMDESNATGATKGDMLTEEEMDKIRELRQLITKDKAIEIVTTNPHLHIDKSLLTYSAYLNKLYTVKDEKNSYVWNITLRDEKPVDYSKDEDNYRAYANATVDAKTGKILSFYASLKDNYDRQTGKWVPVNIKYDKEDGQKILVKFLKEQVKDRFDKSKLVEQNDGYIAYYKEDNVPVYGGYSYRYNRFNEGVEFPYNGINGAVDGVTGKIYSYNVNWDDDIEFESPKNAMTAKEAFNHFINKDGFNLLYEINVINMYDPNYKSDDHYYDYSEAYSVAFEIRLVYRPDIYPNYISPFTGEQLDGRGEVYKVSGSYKYNDIADNPDNREILLLTDMNIGFDGDEFKPEKAITEGEVTRLLEELGYWPTDSEDAKKPSKLITKEEMAYELIKRLGLEKIANIKGIYTSGYADEDEINSKYLGAVALSKGLELFPNEEDNMFNPTDYINRREVVHLLFNYVKAEVNNIY